jgi:hypothetical protein
MISMVLGSKGRLKRTASPAEEMLRSLPHQPGFGFLALEAGMG